MQHSANVEFRVLQRCVNIVDIETCYNMSSCLNIWLRYSRNQAPTSSLYDYVCLASPDFGSFLLLVAASLEVGCNLRSLLTSRIMTTIIIFCKSVTLLGSDFPME